MFFGFWGPRSFETCVFLNVLWFLVPRWLCNIGFLNVSLVLEPWGCDRLWAICTLFVCWFHHSLHICTTIVYVGVRLPLLLSICVSPCHYCLQFSHPLGLLHMNKETRITTTSVLKGACKWTGYRYFSLALLLYFAYPCWQVHNMKKW
jgi:hypothetical protein